MVEKQKRSEWLPNIVSLVVTGFVIAVLVWFFIGVKNNNSVSFMDEVNATAQEIMQTAHGYEQTFSETERAIEDLEQVTLELGWTIYTIHQLKDINAYLERMEYERGVIEKSAEIYHSLPSDSMTAQNFREAYDKEVDALRAIMETLEGEDIPDVFAIETMDINYHYLLFLVHYTTLYELAADFVDAHTPKGVPEGVELKH